MLLTLVGRLIQFGIMFMSLKLMTTLLSPVQMGRVALVTTGVAFFALFLVNPVGMYINRRLHAWFDSGYARGYMHLYALYLMAVGGGAALACLLASSAGFNLAGLEPEWIVILVGGSLFFNTAIQTLIPSLNMLGRELSFTLLNVLTLSISLFFSLIFSYYFDAAAEYWIAGTLAGQMLLSCATYLVLFKKYPDVSNIPGPTTSQAISVFKFCWPIAITVALQWLHMQGYRFVLAEEFGLAEFGLFAVGYSVAAALMSAGESILTTWFQPAFYRSINSDDESVCNSAWSVYAGLMLPFSLLGVSALIAISHILPRLMLGAAYQNAGNFVIVAAIAEWGRMLVGIFGLNAHRHMATRQLIWPNALGALIATVSFVVCVYAFGMGIQSAPICAAIGCVVIVAALIRADKRGEALMNLNLRRLTSQATALLFVAFLITHLLSLMPYQSLTATMLSLMAVGCTWLAFAFLMRGDLKVLSTYGRTI